MAESGTAPPDKMDEVESEKDGQAARLQAPSVDYAADVAEPGGLGSGNATLTVFRPVFFAR